MGELIVLADRRNDLSRSRNSMRPAFFFDVSCPLCYLAAEQVDRWLGGADWIPVASAGVEDDQRQPREQAEVHAAELRMPLVWPERFPAPAPSALRAAAQAAELGGGDRFALAASRLAFCGGFDLEDPEILAEAAAAAGVPLEAALAAARDSNWDRQLYATANGLRSRGIHQLPAIRLGRRWFGGVGAAMQAAALQRTHMLYGDPLAPVV